MCALTQKSEAIVQNGTSSFNARALCVNVRNFPYQFPNFDVAGASPNAIERRLMGLIKSRARSCTPHRENLVFIIGRRAQFSAGAKRESYKWMLKFDEVIYARCSCASSFRRFCMRCWAALTFTYRSIHPRRIKDTGILVRIWWL